MITLTAHDHLPDRPFTYPEHTSREYQILRYMLDQMRDMLDTLLHLSEYFDIINCPDDGRSCRYIIPRPPLLAKADNLAVVGFFGEKRPDATPAHFGHLGERIMRTIPTHPDILGYSNKELESGDFSNLVLLRDEAVKNEWMDGTDHTRAVALSPTYYTAVRIYNGTLTGGITAPQTLTLTKVKYYDYQTSPVWRGERSLR